MSDDHGDNGNNVKVFYPPSASDPTISRQTLLREASSLLSDEGDSLDAEEGGNPEYDRAIAELTCTLLCRSMDEKDAVLTELRRFRKVTRR